MLCEASTPFSGARPLAITAAIALLAGYICGFASAPWSAQYAASSSATSTPLVNAGSGAVNNRPRPVIPTVPKGPVFPLASGLPSSSSSSGPLPTSRTASTIPSGVGSAGLLALILAPFLVLVGRFLQRNRMLANSSSRSSPSYATMTADPTPMAMATIFGIQAPPLINPFTVQSVGLLGPWEEVAGNFVAGPPVTQRLKGVVYFLGGFFFGRVPQLSYRNLLEEMVRDGYLVVATPYQLQGFNYYEVVESVLLRAESTEGFVLKKLEAYGVKAPSDVPVFAVGHSCGALLQLLVESYHPDVARRRTGGTVLLSYNNKPVMEAIPGLESVVSPIARALYSDSGPTLPGGGSIGEALNQSFGQLRTAVRGAIESTASLPIVPPFVRKELLPFEEQLAPFTGQIGSLLEAVAKDELKFNPTATEIRRQATTAYDAPRTLVVQFENDTLDETSELRTLLQQTERVAGKVQYEKLPGNHFTPLTQDPLPLDRDLPPDARAIADALNRLSGGFDQRVRSAALADYRQLARVLLQWLDDGVTQFNPKSPVTEVAEAVALAADWDPEKYNDVEPSA